MASPNFTHVYAALIAVNIKIIKKYCIIEKD